VRRALLIVGLLSVGCAQREAVDREALMDPATCASCHPTHYQQWSGSMHAYAADDPVFTAINQLGQRETNGALGDFCIKCHAPLAVATGATKDGLNLNAVPRRLKGVTCYFCHQVDAVLNDHNGALHLAEDDAFRAGLDAPHPTPAHEMSYSPLHDAKRLASSAMCGACHDVKNPAGTHLERTYAEWRETIFARDGTTALSCSGCHMPASDGKAAEVEGAPLRRVHEHAMPGVDTALSRWPETGAQLDGIQRDLAGPIKTRLCASLTKEFTIEVILDNALVGHSWPSGVTHARRAWVELKAYIDGKVAFSSGTLAPGEAVANSSDPNLWLIRSHSFDAAGGPTTHAWNVARIEDNLLTASVTTDPRDGRYYHAQSRKYAISAGWPDRVDVKVHLQPMGLELLDELIESGDLDPAVRERMPTFTLPAASVSWTSDRGLVCVE